MKIWIGERREPVLVSWRYDTDTKGRTMTTCYVRLLGVKDDSDSARDVEWWGRAHQHKIDTFSKETGRKLSLKRALEQSGFTRVERGQVWENYLTRGGSIF
jgi:hypothetical protein